MLLIFYCLHSLCLWEAFLWKDTIVPHYLKGSEYHLSSAWPPPRELAAVFAERCFQTVTTREQHRRATGKGKHRGKCSAPRTTEDVRITMILTRHF